MYTVICNPRRRLKILNISFPFMFQDDAERTMEGAQRVGRVPSFENFYSNVNKGIQISFWGGSVEC